MGAGIYFYISTFPPAAVLSCSSAMTACHWMLFACKVRGRMNLTVQTANIVQKAVYNESKLMLLI